MSGADMISVVSLLLGSGYLWLWWPRFEPAQLIPTTDLRLVYPVAS